MRAQPPSTSSPKTSKTRACPPRSTGSGAACGAGAPRTADWHAARVTNAATEAADKSDQTGQTRRLRVNRLRQLPNTRPALRRQTQLGITRHPHSPLIREAPSYSGGRVAGLHPPPQCKRLQKQLFNVCASIVCQPCGLGCRPRRAANRNIRTPLSHVADVTCRASPGDLLSVEQPCTHGSAAVAKPGACRRHSNGANSNDNISNRKTWEPDPAPKKPGTLETPEKVKVANSRPQTTTLGLVACDADASRTACPRPELADATTDRVCL